MKQQHLQVFVDIVKQYFEQFANDDLLIDTPYLLENDQVCVHDYTGVIGISGVQKGVVYFSASRAMLGAILDSMGETDQSECNLIDLAGEVANTIAGNAREEFGPKFHISVPLVFKGSPDSDTVILPKDERCYIIPLAWSATVGDIVVCLQG